MESPNHCYCSTWLFLFILENILLVLLWKFPPQTVAKGYRFLLLKYRQIFGFKKRSSGRSKLRIYWDIYYQVKDMLKNGASWGASRIHSELLLLGFDISLSSVKRIIKRILKSYKPFRGNWSAWLRLISQIQGYTVAMDLCRINTVYGSTSFLLAFIHLESRKIVHFNITFNPTRDWILRQIQEAKSLCPQFAVLLRDNDVLFSGRKILQGLEELGIDSLFTPPASPWCNGIMERWFGSLRRECLHHIPILSLNHAQYTVGEYVNYYNFWRPHLALNKDSPCGRVVTFPSPTSKIIKRQVLGGLHHVYFHSEVKNDIPA
ncbi:transposase [Leptospira gomenensis]|uniref:Transposase n=1 Tax=Leptospira gomenensis TaxID=2484974 RepID=A0A5F1YEQ6_9LEPT|nr:integrase core domain-containing protein [Leptospira gomenensis]TGK37650.1 transposase [Leptospira gomenensis]